MAGVRESSPVDADEGTGRTAVLRDYPLRLWAEQTEHTEGLLREFTLLLIGERSGDLRDQAPGQLVALADMFTSRFGAQLAQVTAERQAALDAGLDRLDSRVPLVEGTPELLEGVRVVLEAADDFCRRGDLLTLPRSPELLALADWSRTELVRQYHGEAPTPWPGPF